MLKKKKKEEIEVLELEDDKKKSKLALAKEFLSDKRNKALVKLIIYAVFFIIVILYIRIVNSRYQSSNNNSNSNIEVLPNTITEKMKNLKNLDNYTFTINYDIIDETENKYTINGKVENNNLTIISNSEDEIKNSFLLGDIKLFLADKLYAYLLKSNYQYKKEDLNGNITINSLLKVSDFAYINNNIIDGDLDITLETTENIKDDNVSIKLDMKNYYIINNPSIDEYIVTININYKK